jgi:nucleoside-diphosphate-sugar epimerase
VARILVTGGTGLVGSHAVERLVADGWSVRALVRDPARAAWVGALGAELVPGDLREPDAVRRAASGCDAVFHAAATISPNADWETFRTTNVEGTRAVIRAAADAGARLLHVSSVAVYGPFARYRTAPTSEDVPLEPLPDGALYARSKRESEALVLGAHRRGELWAAAVRPDWIYGRRDRQFVPRTARLLRLRVVPLIGGGRTTLPMVHAANVVDGGVRALAIERAGGEAFNVTNDYGVTFADLVRLGARGLGVRAITVSVPVPLARVGMAVLQTVVGLARDRETAAHGDGVLAALTRDNPFTSEKARRVLGWDPPVRPEVGIPEAFRWYREHGRS